MATLGWSPCRHSVPSQKNSGVWVLTSVYCISVVNGGTSESSNEVCAAFELRVVVIATRVDDVGLCKYSARIVEGVIEVGESRIAGEHPHRREAGDPPGCVTNAGNHSLLDSSGGCALRADKIGGRSSLLGDPSSDYFEICSNT